MIPSEYLRNITDGDCIELYRLDKEGINFISQKIKSHPDISRTTGGGLPVTAQVLVSLRYFATGNSTVSLKNTASLNLSHGSVHNCIKNVSTAIASLATEFVTYPTDNSEILKIKEGFF